MARVINKVQERAVRSAESDWLESPSKQSYRKLVLSMTTPPVHLHAAVAYIFIATFARAFVHITKWDFYSSINLINQGEKFPRHLSELDI